MPHLYACIEIIPQRYIGLRWKANAAFRYVLNLYRRIKVFDHLVILFKEGTDLELHREHGKPLVSSLLLHKIPALSVGVSVSLLYLYYNVFYYFATYLFWLRVMRPFRHHIRDIIHDALVIVVEQYALWNIKLIF